MKRLIYAFDTVESACASAAQLRANGIEHQHLSLVARADISAEKIPSGLGDASMDVLPAVLRGALIGGGTGLGAGLAAMAAPIFGVHIIDGAGLFALIVLGTLIGTWSAGIVGASIPSKVQRRFESEIDAGYILLVIDTPQADVEKVKQWMAAPEPHQIWQGEVNQIAR